MKKFITYCKDSYNELAHHMTWPTRQELSSNTVVVLTASIIIAAVVFLMDSTFQFVMKDFIYPH
ncbi:MAG: preprotein translocase subunit SecE [Bacteroidales bacterium]|nr:preprotein translocase subunit SecE [Bacteroidales bacterium]